MIKEWATVISWQQGVAVLRCETPSSCGQCQSRSRCGATALNALGPQAAHQLEIAVAQPLQPNQRVEIGISEVTLLRAAFMVYMLPLFGVILAGGLAQWWLGSDIAATLGAIAGGGLGFLAARRMAKRDDAPSHHQPIILQIALPVVVLPTTSHHVEE